ncbi:hypothetical protein HDU82_007963 [Entophlyctis luteolus]|nr:hypothetical protein HDU82_007963 [Entophlyctis luteolus]
MKWRETNASRTPPRSVPVPQPPRQSAADPTDALLGPRVGADASSPTRQVLALEQRCALLQERLTTAAGHLNSLVAENRALKASAAERASESSTLQETIESERAAFARERAGFVEKISLLEQNHSSLADSNKQQQDKIAKYTAKLHQILAANKSLNAQIAAMSAASANASAAGSPNGDSTAHKSSTPSDPISAETDTLTARLQETEANLARALTDLEQSRALVDEKSLALDKSNEALSRAHADLEVLRVASSASNSDELQDALERVQALSAQIDREVEATDAARKERDTATARANEYESQIADLTRRIDEYARSAAAFQEEIDQHKQREASNQPGLRVDAVRSAVDYVTTLLKGGLEIADHDDDGVFPDELKDSFNGLVAEVNSRIFAAKKESLAKLESLKSEYDKLIIDLNTELEEKNISLHNLQTQLSSATAEKERLMAESSQLMDRLKTAKATLGPKLHEEMESNKSLKARVEQLTQQVSDLTDEKELVKSQLLQLASQQEHNSEANSNAEAELHALQAEHERLQAQLAALQHHLAESEDAYTQDLVKAQSTVDEYRLQLDALERERASWEDLAAQASESARAAETAAADAKDEALRARGALDEALRARERDSVSLANLQDVLEEFQASKQTEIDLAIDGISKQLASCTAALEEYKSRAISAEERLQKVDLNAPNIQELETQLQERTAEVGKLRGRVISLETYLSEAIRRAASADNQVDRRLVSNLLIQFLATQRGDPKRFEMLTVIASVLKLTDEERVRIGILRSVGGADNAGSGGAGAGARKRSVGVGESFTDLWISFLIKEAAGSETDAAEQAASGAAAAAAGGAGPAALKAAGDGDLTPRASSGAGFFVLASLFALFRRSLSASAMLPRPPPTLYRQRHQLLIVLDLNGTLIDRLGRGHERTLANRNPLCPAAPDLTLNNHKVYLRPYLDTFFGFLFANFHVAAWTSATPRNSGPLVEFIFEPFGGAENLEFVWNREHCIIEPAPDNPYNSVKDLRKIWKAKHSISSELSRGGSVNFEDANPQGIWNEHNTILIDDSASKSCRTPANHLLVPSFSVGDVTLTRNCDEDTSLLSVQSYLEDLLADYVRHGISGGHNTPAWSVQTFLDRNPLYIQENSKLLMDYRHIAYPLPGMRDGRHRAGMPRQLIGDTLGGFQTADTDANADDTPEMVAAKIRKKLEKKRDKKEKKRKREEKYPALQVVNDSSVRGARESANADADAVADEGVASGKKGARRKKGGS